MDIEDIRRSLTICTMSILCIAFLFSIKGCADNRLSAGLAKQKKDIRERLDSEENMTFSERQELWNEWRGINAQLGKKYGVPKGFFFFFILTLCALTAWGLILLSRIQEEIRIRARMSFLLILSLVAVIISLIFFFLLEQFKIARPFWVFLVTFLQWGLIGFSGAMVLSRSLYEKVFGPKKDKDLIEGEPPPAW